MKIYKDEDGEIVILIENEVWVSETEGNLSIKGLPIHIDEELKDQFRFKVTNNIFHTGHTGYSMYSLGSLRGKFRAMKDVLTGKSIITY